MINIDLVNNKNILLLVDFNVPIQDNEIDCTFKIEKTIPTINYLLNFKFNNLTIATHLGRPKNRSEYSTEIIYNYLKQLDILKDINYRNIKDISNLNEGIYFTDNLRYYNQDELEIFYKKFDTIINDAFGSSHRIYPTSIPGLLMNDELLKINQFKCNFIIVGGIKIKDKLNLFNKFKCQSFAGGGIAISILNKLGYEVGNKSKFEILEDDNISKRSLIIDEYKNQSSDTIFIPCDFLVIQEDNIYKLKRYNKIEETDTIIDIGSETLNILQIILNKTQNILYNGPMGKFEDSNATGTKNLLKILEKLKTKIIIGGGETVCALLKYSQVKNFYHVSTGGGSLLSLLCGEEMPSLKKLIYLN